MSWIRKILTAWKTEFDVQQKEKRFLRGLANAPDLLSNPPIIEGEEVNFSHSGHTGDVIYSMPAMYSLAKGRKINLYLRLNQPVTDFTKKMTHPNGRFMLNEKSVAMFTPLLSKQRDINIFKALGDEKVHYDLSIFKAFPFDYRMSSITRYYLLTYGINADLWNPWLHVTPNEAYQETIVIARSSRYHSPGISYAFLSKYANLFFVGLPDEYAEMKKQLPNLAYKPVADFLELTEIIAGSKLFIGNQSFPFAVAEALKAKRVLEVYYQCPNVMVEGPDGWAFCYQQQFEKIVHALLNDC